MNVHTLVVYFKKLVETAKFNIWYWIHSKRYELPLLDELIIKKNKVELHSLYGLSNIYAWK